MDVLSNRTKHAIISVSIVAALGVATGPAVGDMICKWQVMTGNWSNSANWLNGLPSANDWAVIDNGGTVSITGDEVCQHLFLGMAPGTSGFAEMTAGTLDMSGTFQVGDNGTGVFTMTGGSVPRGVSIGSSATGVGTFNLSGSGTVTGGGISLGYDGHGTFTQSGGSVATPANMNYWLNVGGRPHSGYPASADGTGEYTLSGGSVYSWTEIVGGGGTGTFTQTGGWNYVEDYMYLGRLAGGDGTYILNGANADLDVGGTSGGGLILGYSGKGKFSWVQGTFDATSVTVTPGPDPVGDPNLLNVGVDWEYPRIMHIDGGELHVRTPSPAFAPRRLTLDKTTTYQCWVDMTDGIADIGWLTIGEVSSGQAKFMQSGGAVSLEGTAVDPVCLALGQAATGKGRYELDGGSLYVGPEGQKERQESVGHQGTGTFAQTDGVHRVHGSLHLGREAGSSGTYTLASDPALLEVYDICHVGNLGTGTFVQSGGDFDLKDIDGALYLGTEGTGIGTYTMSGSSLLSVAGYEDVGRYGQGTFTQTDGLHSVSGGLYFGRFAGASGTYDLSGFGGLTVGGDETIGRRGSGAFTQTGGLHTVDGDLYFAYTGPHASGDYTLEGDHTVSLAVAGKEFIGHDDTATFVQSGGTHQTTDDLYFGRFPDASGSYVLGAFGPEPGALSVGPYDPANEYIGYGGSGIFTQTDHSTNLVSGDLCLGVEPPTTVDDKGEYFLSGDPLTTTVRVLGNEYVGVDGVGVFTQDGGTNTITNDLYIGWGETGVGTYHLNAGELIASNKYIGYDGTGTLYVNGTPVDTLQDCNLYLGYNPGSSGTCVIGGGATHAEVFFVGRDGSGTLDITSADAEISVSQQLAFGGQSTFAAVDGATIRMISADLEITSTSPGALSGLNRLALEFASGIGLNSTVEVGGRDFGADDAGYDDNFALGALIVGDDALVALTDTHDNRPAWVGSEVLYVSTLRLGPGSELDLNGLTVYYAESEIDDDATVTLDGGALIHAPHARPEDVDGDGIVGFADLLLVLSNWGPCPGCPEDIDGSGDVGFDDLIAVLSAWDH